jgi:hypothetical protein
MEYIFLDKILPVELTNIIASYVGHKNNDFIDEINNIWNETVEDKNIDDEDNADFWLILFYRYRIVKYRDYGFPIMIF